MDFELPVDLTQRLAALDGFIERAIKPLQEQDDNIRFFDHRREYARTDFETVAFRGASGRNCWAKCSGAPTPLAGCAKDCQRRSAAVTEATSTRPSSAST